MTCARVSDCSGALVPKKFRCNLAKRLRLNFFGTKRERKARRIFKGCFLTKKQPLKMGHAQLKKKFLELHDRLPNGD